MNWVSITKTWLTPHRAAWLTLLALWQDPRLPGNQTLLSDRRTFQGLEITSQKLKAKARLSLGHVSTD